MERDTAINEAVDMLGENRTLKFLLGIFVLVLRLLRLCLLLLSTFGAASVRARMRMHVRMCVHAAEVSLLLGSLVASVNWIEGECSTFFSPTRF